jgi:glycosyltransferase involved in cell wall biosynthesis
MRILVLPDRKWPSDHAFLEEVLAQGLPDRGHKVYFIFQSASTYYNGIELDWHGSTVSVLEPISSLRSLLQFIKFINNKIISFKPDVLFVRNNPLLALLLTRQGYPPLAFQLSHQKEETLLLEFRLHPSLKTLYQALKGWCARLFRRAVMRRAEIVFPISKTLLQFLYNSKERTKSMSPIPLGANPVQFPNLSDCMELRDHLNIAADQIILLYLGTLNRLRQLDNLLFTLQDLRERGINAVLVFVGEGRNKEERYFLEKKAYELNLNNAVRFTGRIPRKQTILFICAADIGLSYLPNYRLFKQNSPIKVMEYLSAGLPVVATPQPEQQELIEATEGGIVSNSDNPYEFAEAIYNVLSIKWDRNEIRSKFFQLRDYQYITDILEFNLKTCI